jgi:hypothetical protein
MIVTVAVAGVPSDAFAPAGESHLELLAPFRRVVIRDWNADRLRIYPIGEERHVAGFRGVVDAGCAVPGLVAKWTVVACVWLPVRVSVNTTAP